MSDEKELEALLTAIQDIAKIKTKLCIHQDERGEHFNVFSLCGVDHYEVIHSRILAEFLNPRGSHGQTDGSFLKVFFEMLAQRQTENGVIVDYATTFGKFNENTVVKTELSGKLGGLSVGRFDIYLENPQGKAACVIENKIFAGEQPDQLKRYSEWLKHEREEKYGYKTCLVFLTLDGREATTSDNKEYICAAYHDAGRSDILSWLKTCRQLACDKPFVRETIAQYCHHLENLINGGQIMANDVVDCISKHFEAAQHVYESYCVARDIKAQTLFEEFRTLLSKGSFPNRSAFSGCFDSGHKEAGYYWECMDGVFVTIGFEDTSLKGFFIGISKENIPDNLQKTSVEQWIHIRENLRSENDSLSTKLEWDEATEQWPIWRYVGKSIEVWDWDGRFFSALDKDPTKKNQLFEEMNVTLQAIQKVVEQLMNAYN